MKFPLSFRLPLVSLGFLLIGIPASGQSEFWDPLPQQRSTNPAVYNQDRTNLISSRVRGADTVGVFFVGNSITHFWESDGRDVWNQYYADLFPINAGISGDRTQGVLNRFLNGNLDFQPGVHPKVAVVMIGTNNIGWNPSDTPGQTVDGVRAVLQLMIRRLPYTRILLLGIFPRNGSNANGSYRDQINTINTELEGFADGEIIHYLDIGDVFLNTNGSINLNVMPDGLHPNSRGYSLWAEAMDSRLNELLALEPLKPIRIMPLGNSITEGTSTLESYRYHLDGMLRQAGYDFDFVGSLNRHRNNGLAPDSYEFDVDHEGHWARKADWLMPRLRGYAEDADPDLVLLHIGTNDINHESGSPQEVTDRTLSEIRSLIDTLRAVNPEVTVLLAKIIPTTGTDIPNANEVIDRLNAGMDTLVASVNTGASRVELVDQNTEFNTNTDMTDPYHPNEAGALKMARRWLEGIQAIMDTSGNVTPVPVQMSGFRRDTRLTKVLFGENLPTLSALLCRNCNRADVYDISGKKIFHIEAGQTLSPDQISYRGLGFVHSY